MKVKVLKIRVSDQFQNMDEAILNDYLQRYDIIDLHTQLIAGDINYWSVFINYEEKEPTTYSKTSDNSKEELADDEVIIYDRLKKWRAVKAKELQLPPYIIFSNANLVTIAKNKSATIKELENIKGLGNAKINKYGLEIIEVLEKA